MILIPNQLFDIDLDWLASIRIIITILLINMRVIIFLFSTNTFLIFFVLSVYVDLLINNSFFLINI